MAMGWNFLRAGLMMLANPMVLAIVAIGAAIGVLAYLVYTNWDRIKAAFGAGWEWVKSTLAAAPAWLSNIGGMMMQGLLAMIDPFGLRNKLLEVARNGVDAFKAFFGIKSPSRLMMEMGGHVANGFALGIDGQGQSATRAARRMATGVAAAGALSLSPALATPGMANRQGPSAPAQITIHVHAAPGMDTKALAREVRRELEAAQGVRQRSRYDAGAADGFRAHPFATSHAGHVRLWHGHAGLFRSATADHMAPRGQRPLRRAPGGPVHRAGRRRRDHRGRLHSRDRGPLQRARYARQHGRHRKCLAADERTGRSLGLLRDRRPRPDPPDDHGRRYPAQIDFTVTLKRKA
jgi:hypothetical protein